MTDIGSWWVATDLAGLDERCVKVLRHHKDGERLLVEDESGERGWIWEEQLVCPAHEPEPPTWQPSLFGGKDSIARQRKLFDDTPEPQQPKDREDLPGQQMLPGL